MRVFVLPDRMWQWADEGATVLGLQLDVCNLSRDIQYLSGRGEPVIKHGAVCGGQLWEAQLIYLNESADIRPEPVGIIRGKEVSRNADGVETKVNAYEYFRVDFYLDKRTHLPVRIDIWQHVHNLPNAPPFRYELGDYADMAGVMIPRRVIEQTISTRFSWDYGVRLNVPYRDEAFMEAPSLENGPYAWMTNEDQRSTR